MDILKEDIMKMLAGVKHPAIDLSLLELGMLRNIVIDGNKISVEFVFPFPNIPIKEVLFASVREPLEAMGLTVSFTESLMTQDEVQRFLALETENWKN